MTPAQKNVALWLAGWTALIVAVMWLLILLHGCGGEQRSAEPPANALTALVDLAACEDEMMHQLLSASSCNEAQFKIDAMIATVKVCKNYPHFEVCAPMSDGGIDGD